MYRIPFSSVILILWETLLSLMTKIIYVLIALKYIPQAVSPEAYLQLLTWYPSSEWVICISNVKLSSWYFPFFQPSQLSWWQLHPSSLRVSLHSCLTVSLSATYLEFDHLLPPWPIWTLPNHHYLHLDQCSRLLLHPSPSPFSLTPNLIDYPQHGSWSHLVKCEVDNVSLLFKTILIASHLY